MPPPEGLQLDYVLHVCLKQFVIVTLSRERGRLEAICTFVRPPAQPLQLSRLAVHVELGMLAIFAHAV